MSCALTPYDGTVNWGLCEENGVHSVFMYVGTKLFIMSFPAMKFSELSAGVAVTLLLGTFCKMLVKEGRRRPTGRAVSAADAFATSAANALATSAANAFANKAA